MVEMELQREATRSENLNKISGDQTSSEVLHFFLIFSAVYKFDFNEWLNVKTSRLVAPVPKL